MSSRYYFILLLLHICKHSKATIKPPEQTSSSLLPSKASSIDISKEDDVVSSSYVLPNQIFNDGKPYYARQDPVSGQLDFSAKKPAGIEPEVNEVLNSKEKIVLNSGSTPNIHDFLNLPVKYSSSNFVYPLVSSSYANLKYQGSNKNYMTNKKPTLVSAPATPLPPKYHNDNYFTASTTKLTAVTPLEADANPVSMKTSTFSPLTSTLATPTTSTATTVRVATTTSRPVPKFTLTTTLPSRLITTRKKFIPSKKNSHNLTIPSASPNIQMTTNSKPEETATKFAITLEQPKPTLSSSAGLFTTHHPTPQASIFPTEPTSTTKMITTPSTSRPVVFTEDFGSDSSVTITTQATTTTRNSSNISNLEPADVYYTLGQKNNKVQQEHDKRPTTLSEIFNSLAEEEMAVANNYQQNQGFDAQGNIIEPISPSQPSPFAMNSQSRPNSITSQNVLYGASEDQNNKNLVSGGHESYSNEYVSYQVQQPNVMKYRPVPGQMNNVVISPGQQSATFVLGSQQQVSHSNSFVNEEKEALFSKGSPGVQYGQVINEDISKINRPNLSNQQNIQGLQQPTPPTNFYQKLNNQSNIKFQANKSPDTTNAETGVLNRNYPELSPEVPSPYQQLPLIGSNLSPSKKKSSLVPDSPAAVQITPHVQSAMQSSPLAKPPATIQDTQELLVSSNIRFPESEDVRSSFVVRPGPPAAPHINGHAQPLSLQQIQNSNQIVFPKIVDEKDSGGSVQIQKHEVININQHNQQLMFPAQQQNNNEQPMQQLISQDMEPPPRFPPMHISQVHPSSPNRPNISPPSPLYKELHRKPQPLMQTGIRPSSNLPNILPQFRPNAKISSGHTPNLRQEPGNIRLPTKDNFLNSPQFAHRRQPLQQQHIQKRFPVNHASDHEYLGGPAISAGDVNRRIYRVPPNSFQRTPNLRDRTYFRRPNEPLRTVDNYSIERHALTSTEPYKLITSDLDDLEEEDLVINHPPHSPNKDYKNQNEPRLEAVVTLQMLQSQKKSFAGDDNGTGEIQVTDNIDQQETKSTKLTEQKTDQLNLYTVENKDTSLTQDLPSASIEYQNTPFSVIREEPQEPILKNKKPQSLQQQKKDSQPPKEKFPYRIEKPDPSYTKLKPTLYVPGESLLTQIVNTNETKTPIAIAYTPTESNSVPAVHISNVNYGSALLNEMRPETQTESSINADFDIRGQKFEKDFMAPFFPSISLAGGNGDATENPKLSNWKIVSPLSDQTIHSKNYINRADVDIVEKSEQAVPPNSTNTTSEKYVELDSFQPQLQGGFKPIYPPDYVHVEHEVEKSQLGEDDEKPLALPLKGLQFKEQLNISSITTLNPMLPQAITPHPVASNRTLLPSTTLLPTTIKTELVGETTTKAPATQIGPTQHKKPTFETSLSALLFGDDLDYEEETRKSANIEKVPTGPKNIARMGPRSLVLS